MGEPKDEVELLYRVTDRPPLLFNIILSFQQVLLSLSGSLAVSSFVADAACAERDADFKAQLLGSTLFMNGVTTLCMVLLGIRLPLYQGAAALYIIPLLAIQSVDKNRCNLANADNITSSTAQKELILSKVVEMQGSLIAAGIIHCLIGALGLVGVALRFIGPITIVPTMLMTGIYLSKATTKFSKTNWGVASVTACVSILLSIYMCKYQVPIPQWSKTRGWYVKRYHLHQMFSILLGMLTGWGMAAILTTTGSLTDDPSDVQYLARTDARAGVISNARWFYVPYPGQFGAPKFDGSVFSSFLVATFISILDSIGDYYVCAKISNAPPPPRHAVNRGIAIEGLCTALSGAMGCGHATSTQGGNIGAIGVTRVASRSVFLGAAIIYIIFGVVTKVSAVFITMPYPVLGGGMIVMYGMVNGVALSNLNVVSLTSGRNLAIMGIAIMMGLVVPNYIATTENPINTGNTQADNILEVLLANPNLTGGLVACLLDNTAPGTLEERGISAWRTSENFKPPEKTDDLNPTKKDFNIYMPLLPKSFLKLRIIQYIPFLPYTGTGYEATYTFPEPNFTV